MPTVPTDPPPMATPDGLPVRGSPLFRLFHAVRGHGADAAGRVEVLAGDVADVLQSCNRVPAAAEVLAASVAGRRPGDLVAVAAEALAVLVGAAAPAAIAVEFKDPATGEARRVECATAEEARAVADDVFRRRSEAGVPSPLVNPRRDPA